MRILQKEKRTLGSRRLHLPVDKTRNGVRRRSSGLQRVCGRKARTKALGSSRRRQRGQMNLLQSDVLTAREALAPWDLQDIKITAGWYEGNISVIIECEVDMMVQEMLRSILETTTSINIPIVFKRPEKEFSFNFSTAS